MTATPLAQLEPTTADQVISKYVEAIGADRFSTVTTFVERGEFKGNLTNFWHGSQSPAQARDAEHGTYEFYFKSPNPRFTSSVTDKKRLIELRGCDGKVGWHIDAYMRRTELKPKPGSEGECKEGFKPDFSRLQESNVKMRLVGKKEFEGRVAWEVKVDVPKSPDTETYYFDGKTFLLLRFEKHGMSVTYSDYRDAGGMKFPFTTVQEFNNSNLVATVRELKINDPIDDSQFTELQVKNGRIQLKPAATSKKADAEAPKSASPDISTTLKAETSSSAPPKSASTSNAPSIVEVNFPNFTSCTVAEIETSVLELKGLKPATDQTQLPTLLDKIGAKTLDIALNTPNLISRETVTQSQQGASETRRDYDYLILPRINGKIIDLDEFRVDLKSGEKFENDEAMKDGSSTRAGLERASGELAASESGRAPLSHGFASSWVHFYPPNQSLATFRYLGNQKMYGLHTLVVAFAQKPAYVTRPGMFYYQGKTVPMFLQGVAWVDPTDFRIVRLRTDLLAPLPEVSLHRLTADIQFGLTRIETVPSPISLPHEVRVEAEVGESTLREIHTYSDYRLFRARSRVVSIP